LDRRLGVPQSLSGRGGEERKSLPVPRIEPQSSIPVETDKNYIKKTINLSGLRLVPVHMVVKQEVNISEQEIFWLPQ
jgi:hypothetical protein